MWSGLSLTSNYAFYFRRNFCGQGVIFRENSRNIVHEYDTHYFPWKFLTNNVTQTGYFPWKKNGIIAGTNPNLEP